MILNGTKLLETDYKFSNEMNGIVINNYTGCDDLNYLWMKDEAGTWTIFGALSKDEEKLYCTTRTEEEGVEYSILEIFFIRDDSVNVS